MDKTIILIIVAIVLVGGVFWGWQSGFFVKTPPIAPTPLPAGIVLFFGAECPHCKIVEDFVTANNISQKVKFTQLEVPFGDKTSTQLQANAELAIKIAQGCKLDVTNGISIPFLYDGKNCLVGQDDVINFFKAQAGIK